MSEKKDNVIQFPTKANVPDTVTISFGDSDPVTYSLTSDNIDLSGIDSLDTVTVDITDGYAWDDDMYSTGWYDFGDDDTITVTVSEDSLVSTQLSLDLDED